MSRPLLLVFSDLDGCLLDHHTYSYDAARPALALLRRRGAELLLVSSKTRGEMLPLVRSLGLAAPFAVENGGALVLPAGRFPQQGEDVGEDGWSVVPLGTPREELVRALAAIAAETQTRVQGFAGLPPATLTHLTGLPKPAAVLAGQREYDEPFLLEGDAEATEAVTRAAARRGLRVTQGGRFHHLTGPTDKGAAVRRMLALYRGPATSVALGDARNDASMLAAVERPILMPDPSGRFDPDLVRALPLAERAPRPGPSGWNAAVVAVLEGRTLPRVGRDAVPDAP